jgi:hypothetical protein
MTLCRKVPRLSVLFSDSYATTTFHLALGIWHIRPSDRSETLYAWNVAVISCGESIIPGIADNKAQSVQESLF